MYEAFLNRNSTGLNKIYVTTPWYSTRNNTNPVEAHNTNYFDLTLKAFQYFRSLNFDSNYYFYLF
jgi:hypothetical protein